MTAFSLFSQRRRRRRIKLRHGNGSSPNLVAGFLSFAMFSIFLEYFPFSWNLFHFLGIFSIFQHFFNMFNFSMFLEICNSVIIILSGKDKQKLELASSVYKRCKQIFQSIFMSGSNEKILMKI